MKAPDFGYERPGNLEEALRLLAKHGDDAAIIAGGQSLLALLNFRMAAPELLIDIGRLDKLKQISDQDGHIEIGGLVRHCDLAASPLIARSLPLLPRAISHIAHPAVRHRGTIGGSLAMADPAAELAACCLALDGQFLLISERGERWVRAEDFFQGVYETALAADEVLTAVRLPKRGADGAQIFMEIARRQGDFAMAGLACVDDGARIALLGVADRPVLVSRHQAEPRHLHQAIASQSSVNPRPMIPSRVAAGAWPTGRNPPSYSS